MLMICLLCSLGILFVLSTRVALMITSTFPNLSATFSNSMSISIACIIKYPLWYNSISLLYISLIFPDVWLVMCLTVTNLIFLSGMIMNTFPFTNITSSLTVTNVYNLYKYSGVVRYSSMFTLLDFCLNVFPLTPYKYDPKIYFC